ncbi:MAG: ATP-binding protein [Dehalococcoidales bacterium]|nr:ATP-binding protein [Dehalococcoidales bacterium]
MEHISQDLAKLQQNTPAPKNSYNSEEPEPTEIKEGSSEWVAQKLRAFNISSLNHTFGSFKMNGDNKEALATMKALSDGELKKQFVLLYGTTGCGKTHLIEATIINWAKRNIRSYYMTFSEMTRKLKTALRQGGEYYDEQFKSLRDRKILIVDDFGMGTTESKFEISDLEDIIDLRYRKRYYPDCDLVTILATNKDIKELPDRVVSRFYDPEFGVVLYMGDKDYRRRVIK